jgi:hypothetical protein
VLLLLLLLLLLQSLRLPLRCGQPGTQLLRLRQPLHPAQRRQQQPLCSRWVGQQHPPACRQLCSSKPCTQVLLLLLVTTPSPLWWQVGLRRHQRWAL